MEGWWDLAVDELCLMADLGAEVAEAVIKRKSHNLE